MLSFRGVPLFRIRWNKFISFLLLPEKCIHLCPKQYISVTGSCLNKMAEKLATFFMLLDHQRYYVQLILYFLSVNFVCERIALLQKFEYSYVKILACNLYYYFVKRKLIMKIENLVTVIFGWKLLWVWHLHWIA